MSLTAYKGTPAKSFAGLSAGERTLVSTFAHDEKTVVTANDVVAIRPMSRGVANRILSRLHHKGWLRRLKRGAYSPVPLSATTTDQAIEAVWPLAMELFAPCFISGWSAAEYWDLTDQIFNAVAVYTTRPQRAREHSVGGVTYRTRVVSSSHMFGTTRVWLGSKPVDVADPHRTIIDILDAPEMGGGGQHVIEVVRAYWKSQHADATKLLEYAERLGKGTVFKRLGYTAELFGTVNDNWREKCLAGMSAGVSRLDPAAPDKGKIVSRWRLRINTPIE